MQLTKNISDMSHGQYHAYHMVTPSPWPFAISIAALITTIGATMYMHMYAHGLALLSFGLVMVVLIMGLWWRDVIREGTFEGMHTVRVQSGLKIGFILFIVSEVMFFFAFFWAFFHNGVSPDIAIGSVWPPNAIVPFDPMQTPLVNTAVLLLSGATITYAHHGIISGDEKKAAAGFIETIILAIIFTGLQYEEYINAPFAISDSVFGSTFYMITGLHGTHVIIGTLFIIVCLLRLRASHFTRQHHLGFEFAAWYWHFVDVVWLFVYTAVYWWGGF